MTQPIPLYPLLLTPTLHVKVWGGRRLETHLHIPLPDDQPYGEAWEMHDTAVVADGALAGRTVGSLLAEYGTALVGDGHDASKGMPLLAKFLDANDWLSVQVHPDDALAAEIEGEPRGKTEAWYVIAAEPGARLVIGVKPEATRDQLADAIEQSSLEDSLVYAEVVPGDVLFVAAGTIHALGPGILIYEIQQSSDTTYRLYDWGRMDLNGRPRALHIDKGLRVSRLGTLPQIQHTAGETELTVDIVRSPFFDTVLHRLTEDDVPLPVGDRFHILTCISGEAAITVAGETTRLSTGRTALIPATLTVFSLSGHGEVLRSYMGNE